MQISRLTAADHPAVLDIAAEAHTPVEPDELTRDVAHVWVARDTPQEVAGFLLAWAVADEVPEARVYAVELDPAAHAWAERNLAGTGVDLSEQPLPVMPDELKTFFESQ